MTNEDLNTIREELCRLAVLVEGWDDPDGISVLERDLALAKLRELYDLIFFTTGHAAKQAETSFDAAEPLSISLDDMLLAVVPASEIEEEPQPEPVAVVLQPEPEPVVTEIQVATPNPQVVTPATEEVKPYEPVLFGMDELTQHKRKQRVIMSLYGDAPADPQIPNAVEIPVASPVEEPQSEPILVVETPQPVVDEQVVGAQDELDSESEIEILSMAHPAEFEQGAILGEVINRGLQTLGETLTQSRSTVSEAAHLSPIDDLRTAIGINDRFLLVRDLFDGNAVACDTLIEKLNSFDNLDDCMVYIAEHYVWNPNSDGAKLLVELLERKLD